MFGLAAFAELVDRVTGNFGPNPPGGCNRANPCAICRRMIENALRASTPWPHSRFSRCMCDACQMRRLDEHIVREVFEGIRGHAGAGTMRPASSLGAEGAVCEAPLGEPLPLERHAEGEGLSPSEPCDHAGAELGIDRAG